MTSVRLVDSAKFPVRIAFAQNLFEMGTFDGEGKPAFSSTFIIGRDHPVHAELEAAEAAAAKAKWGEKAPAMLTAIRKAGKGVVKDGDLKAQWSGFEGNDFISSRSEKRPNVFDRDGSQLTAADGKVYSGCYVHGIVEVWAQDNKFGKRINAQLTGVMFSRDGDSFGGGAAPAAPEAFADLSAAEEGMLD
jgi:hypothetical protein